MSTAAIDRVVKLLSSGYLPYKGPVEQCVYDHLECTQKKHSWFVKEGRYFVCLGCPKACSLADPAGFQFVLPRKPPRFKVAVAELPYVSADDLLKKLGRFNVSQAAYVLGLSERTVYDLIDGGRLTLVDVAPKLISKESLFVELERRREAADAYMSERARQDTQTTTD